MNNPSPIPLSIIIVNYRSANLIIDNLKTLYQYNKELLFEVIVVDNASGDDSSAKILNAFPQIKWIEMGYNAGFARGNNAGIKAANGEIILLLNPDTLSIDDSITQCYYKLKNSEAIAAGVQLIDAQLHLQISGSRFVKWGLNHLLPIPYWGDFVRWIGYKSGSKDPNVQTAKEIEEVDWISGAFLMVKMQAIEKAGLLDEDFFLYAEEVEWCSRLKKWGKLFLFGKLKIIHLEGATINKSQNLNEKGYYNLYDKKGLQLMVSNHLRLRKQYGVLPFLFLLLNYTWGVIVFLIAGFFSSLLHARNPFGHINKVTAFAENVVKLWGLTPRIISNKPYFYKVF
jgi:GT2 family glycosyltransferase